MNADHKPADRKPVDRKPRRRRLSDDEHALWQVVIRSVAPLKRRRAPLESADSHTAAAKPVAVNPVAVTALAGPVRPSPPLRPAPSVTAPRLPKAPLVLSPIDRRLKHRIARGTVEIDARIDLHGMTQSEAHVVLLHFLRRAQADGARTVLVITGKGGASDDPGSSGRGVLKRQVPQWLALQEFRVYVIGMEEAHVGHGGAGALYVRMRRSR
jgi:DNA-nicking Smr family endonuclease